MRLTSLLLMVGLAAPVFAQMDFAGDWAVVQEEDFKVGFPLLQLPPEKTATPSVRALPPAFWKLPTANTREPSTATS